MNFITLGTHKIEVDVSMGIRMIRHTDVKELLGLHNSELSKNFTDAKLVTDTLFEKIYESKNASKEQEVVFRGLCIVGIYSLIDEVCKIDLRGVSYVEEFSELVRKNRVLDNSKIKTKEIE